ncbi:MAG: thioesterase family protein [Deltaproteobacteria bacterium]|nr:thioesterase family protein [Deltaproteobacteria bacterium]MBW1961103.1 thioesterase family protein [Deltaproteobacteria bacterium]MBW2150479.1 thioesterase family protein [Deltaproteobacteria bacterium]
MDKQLELDVIKKTLCEVYEQRIPFNKIIGIRIDSLSADNTRIRFQMKKKLIGNYVKEVLHGGVISAVLDVAGGITASFGVLLKMVGEPFEEIERRLSKIGTIDLRVDYLRPGAGKYFESTSSIMRAGRRVTVTRMELVNDEGLLVAVGTGTYLVG